MELVQFYNERSHKKIPPTNDDGAEWISSFGHCLDLNPNGEMNYRLGPNTFKTSNCKQVDLHIYINIKQATYLTKSNLPGRRRAASIACGRFVAAKTRIPCSPHPRHFEFTKQYITVNYVLHNTLRFSHLCLFQTVHFGEQSR